MILNKRRLFLGLTLSTLGILLYNSIKDHEEELKHIKIDASNKPINIDNVSENSTKDNYNDIINRFNDLKKQVSLLEDRLNELKK